MNIHFLSGYNFVKKAISSILLIYVCLSGCENVGVKDAEEEPAYGTDDTYVVGSRNNKKISSIWKYVGCIFGGACLGAAIATAIEIPIYSNRLSTANQNYNDLVFSCNSQQNQLFQSILPTLAENKNALYTLSNGSTVLGSNITSSNFGVDDFRSIVGISSILNSSIYTPEEECAFTSIGSVVPNMQLLSQISSIGQYIGFSTDLSQTSLGVLNLSSSILNGTMIVPNSINTISLIYTGRCIGGNIFCTGGNVTSPNCTNRTINSFLTSFNTQVINSQCGNITIVEQLYTNSTVVNEDYETLKQFLINGGLAPYVTCTNNLKNMTYAYNVCSQNNTYSNASALYLAANTSYNQCESYIGTCCEPISIMGICP